jgi:hypothetical protein
MKCKNLMNERVIMDTQAMDYLIDFFDTKERGKGFSHEISGVFKLRDADSKQPLYVVMHPHLDTDFGDETIGRRLKILLEEKQVLLMLDNDQLYKLYSSGELLGLKEKVIGIVMTEICAGDFFDIEGGELADIFLQYFSASQYIVCGEELNVNSVEDVRGCLTGLFGPVEKMTSAGENVVMDLSLTGFSTYEDPDEGRFEYPNTFDNLTDAGRRAVEEVLQRQKINYIESVAS